MTLDFIIFLENFGNFLALVTKNIYPLLGAKVVQLLLKLIFDPGKSPGKRCTLSHAHKIVKTSSKSERLGTNIHGR